MERIKTFIQGLEQDGLDSIEYAEVVCCNEMSIGAGTTNTTTCNSSYNDKNVRTLHHVPTRQTETAVPIKEAVMEQTTNYTKIIVSLPG